MKLRMQMISALSGFSVINALRDLHPGKTNNLVI